MKNIEVFAILNKISKIENLKLGGVKLKIVLKNKKAVIKDIEDLEEVKKKLIEQYNPDKLESLDQLPKEVQDNLNKDWNDVLMSESSLVLDKVFSVPELDQFSDLTLEQYEVLELMSE